MKTKIESDFELPKDYDYELDTLFHDRDISFTGGCSPFKDRNLYQYSIRAMHAPSGISIQIYETSLEEDDEEFIKKLKTEAYEELRYLVMRSPRYLRLTKHRTIQRNRLLGFENWVELEAIEGD
jgi:hypothetical protein